MSILQRLLDHIALPVHNIKGFDGVKVYLDKDGILRIDPYEICWMWYPIALANPKNGFYAATGGVISNASVVAPRACTYLQTAEGQTLCTTLAEWNAEYNDSKWGGLQGACAKWVFDKNANTIKLPDVRGCTLEQAGMPDGTNSLSVGGAHADVMRPITGRITAVVAERGSVASGAFTSTRGNYPLEVAGTNYYTWTFNFDSALLGPNYAGNATKPRAFGANVCVYLGTA